MFGLRTIAAIMIAANLLAYALVSRWDPMFWERGLAGDALVALALLAGAGLTFWPPFGPHARWVTLVILALAATTQIQIAIRAPDFPADASGFGSLVVTISLMLASAALPVRPLQTCALGIGLTGVLALSLNGARAPDSFEEAFPIAVSIVTTFVAVALSAAVYQRRVETFRARREAERALEALEAAQGRLLVTESAASQTRLAATMAHELNTPLGTLASSVSTLTRAFERQGHSEERLKIVVTQASESSRQALTRLDEIVARMKRITNLDRAEWQPVDMSKLSRDCASLVSEEIPREVALTLGLSSVPTIRARPQQLAAVISNLLRNAVAAIDGEGTVSLSTSTTSEEILVEVVDDGRGISEAHLPHLFEPTFRASAGTVGTTNWGLFTARGIVHDHGGQIEIDSTLGRGTRVRVLLPVTS